MKKPKRTHFRLYRYQILPFDRHFTGDFFEPKITSVADLIARKNEFFAAALMAKESFDGGQTKIATKRLVAQDEFYLYKIGANRSLNIEKRDFTQEEWENWPSILVAIWNKPEQQLIAVQKRPDAFQLTDTVVRLVVSAVSAALEKRQLRVLWEPLFEKSVFWDVIAKNAGKISSIQFELVTPNMANISDTLSDDLKDFAKLTNSTKNKVSIEADPSAALKIEKGNKAIEGLVDYSSAGGGDIAIKLVGVKKKIHTSRTIKEVEISEAEIQGTPDSVAAVLKQIMTL